MLSDHWSGRPGNDRCRRGTNHVHHPPLGPTPTPPLGPTPPPPTGPHKYVATHTNHLVYAPSCGSRKALSHRVNERGGAGHPHSGTGGRSMPLGPADKMVDLMKTLMIIENGPAADPARKSYMRICNIHAGNLCRHQKKRGWANCCYVG